MPNNTITLFDIFSTYDRVLYIICSDSITRIDEIGQKRRQIWPMGVCAINSTNNGNWTYFMVVCDGYDSANLVNYDNEYCLGEPTSIQSVADYFDSVNRTQDYQSFEVQCCIGPCQIGTRIQYFTPGCNETNYTISEKYSMPNIIGACSSTESADGSYVESIKYSSCSNGKLIEEVYNTLDCSGAPNSTTDINDGDCVSFGGWGGWKTEVECGIALDTCPFNDTSPPEPTWYDYKIICIFAYKHITMSFIIYIYS